VTARRAVYTVRYPGAIYVLHVFQKKSKRGVSTNAQDMDKVVERLKRAAAIHEVRIKERRE
jgi:phage-related protein